MRSHTGMRPQIMVVILMVLSAVNAAAQDSTRAIASRRYARPAIHDRIFLGRNYRSIWGMPVTAKIFRLNEEKGGLKIKKRGGGMQTLSLHLEDKDDHDWLLRSIDKNVDKAMEAVGIKNKRVRRLSQKMISAAHPYGALTVVPMSRALCITSTEPMLVFVPDDTAFGEFREQFAGTLCLLEHREPSRYAGSRVISTEKMLLKLKEDSSYHIDQKLLLQARLLDMLIGDWDRHAEQWKWEFPEGAKDRSVYPIPRDHDQAYFNSTGPMFQFMRLFNAHMFVGFRKHMKLTALNYKSWSFDKSMLSGLSEDDWRGGIRLFQAALTDSVLRASVRQLPPEVFAASGERLYAMLKTRRERMLRAGMRYYRFLQTHPKKIAKQERKEREHADRAAAIDDEE